MPLWSSSDGWWTNIISENGNIAIDCNVPRDTTVEQKEWNAGLEQVLQYLSAYNALGVEGETLEGYLFPETYYLPHGLTAREVAKVMVDQFFSVWREIEAQASEQKLSMQDVVTLASIVEKETAVTEERPLIAAVFRNRLMRGMRLETDPTVIYGLQLEWSW